MTTTALRQLFSSLGVEFLSSNRYSPESLMDVDVRRTWYYRCNRREFLALSERYSGFLQSPSRLPELEVQELGSLLGRGLFTPVPLRTGDLIGEYTGIVRKAVPGRALVEGVYSSDYSWGFPGLRNFGPQMEIDAREAGGILRFANHAAEASAAPDHFPVDGRWHIVFVALKDISAGSEITVNYGEAYWSSGDRELV